mgnify:CR=1 FL=1
MPAKALCTPFKLFAHKCMATTTNATTYAVIDNIFVRFNYETMKLAFQKYLKIPLFVASHMESIIQIAIRYATMQSLLIYIHHKETHILMAAIKQNSLSLLCLL